MMRNRLLLKSNFSPIQRVLGYAPRLPGGLLTGDEENRHVNSRVLVGDRALLRRQQLRLAAAKAFFEVDCSAALRRAVTSGPRPPLDGYEIGQKVYFWRKGPGRAKRARGSTGMAQEQS